MAITAAGYQQTTTPIPPCGSCRQSIAEYEIKQETPIDLWEKLEIFINLIP
jgi:cytidine deaminase